MLNLVAYAPDGVRRFPIGRTELLIGSQPRCDIYLPYTGVAHRHAVLRYDGRSVEIEDLGTRKGVLVGGERVKGAVLEELDEVRLGSVTLLVEAAAPEQPEAADAPVEVRTPTMSPEVMLEHVARIGKWVLADPESRTPLESLVGDLLLDCGGGVLLLLLEGDDVEEPGIKFVSSTEPRWLASGEELLPQIEAHAEASGTGSFAASLRGEEAWVSYHRFEAVNRTYSLIVALPRFAPEGWSMESSLAALGYLLVLGLVHHLGWYEPILPGRESQGDLVLDPGLVVGESPAMKRVLEQLREAVDSEAIVLLRGEEGVGKELLSRSLHLSTVGPGREMLEASCTGASAQAIEADLFGSVIQGKEGPVRRKGKLEDADGSTLLLDHVDELPLPLQARLVRFLRSGEVEPAGGGEAVRVDTRLVVASAGALEPLASRDEFRVDLAHRLSRCAVDIPPLRARREDLPLLIQSAINRWCHKSGKRMQGITVKAMSALMAYGFPGNLTELETLARQVVYLCPPGRPIDVALLPERVRLATVEAEARVDSTTELALDELVANTERAAIREALRRTHQNQSQAARLLGLSRNGLAMKMRRLGLKR